MTRLIGTAVALTTMPLWVAAQDTVTSRATLDEIPVEVPDRAAAEETVQEERIVHTRFYWPKYATAEVTVEVVENDQSVRYG
ncbi:MAG: hypothetical protein ACF8NJ_06755, partial [Phycisphaerales bacterium JB038]